MAWTTVSKPTDSNWSFVSPQGRQTYDEATITYDEASVFYDSVDMDAWTDVPKPANGVITGGMATGLLIPLTRQVTTGNDPWTYISKPTD